MNLVRLADQFPSSDRIRYGLVTTFYHLSREQARLGSNVHVICRRYPGEKSFERVDSVNVHRVNAPYSILSLSKLFELSYSFHIDLVHTHATSGLSYALTKKLFPRKLNKVKHIAHVHGTTLGIDGAWACIGYSVLEEETKKGWITRNVSKTREMCMWKSADAVIANSKFLREELANLYGISRERIWVVNNGVCLTTFYPRETRETVLKELGLTSDSKLLLYLGGFRPVKGPEYIVRAIEKIQKNVGNVRVLFVGGKHPIDRRFDKAVEKLIERLRKRGTLNIIDNISHLQLPRYYSASDAVVVPSIYDTYPKVILEAMACGTPVIASAVGGIPEIITNWKTGILVEPANPDELAEAIIGALSDYDLRKQIAVNARKLVRERFTWEKAAEEILAVYRQCLSK